MSYAFYFGVLLICGLFAWLANRHNSKACVWMIIITLTLVAGLRDYSVGIDTQNYVNLFHVIEQKRFQYAYGLEESFKYICYAVLVLFKSDTVLLLLLGLLTNWCIIVRFWELRKISSFTCMVVCYYAAFFFMTLNGMRQFCAVAIIFFGTRYLSSKKILWFIVCVVLAMMFHRSAAIGFMLLAINCLRWKELPKGQRIFYLTCALLVPILFAGILPILQRYEKYFYQTSVDIGFMLPLKLVFLAATVLWIFVLHKQFSYFRFDASMESSDRYNMLMATISYVLALLLAMLGYAFPTVSRISWYVYLFEGVYFGMLLKGKSPLIRVLLGYAIALVIGYGFIYSMTNDSQGNMPYLFIWQ